MMLEIRSVLISTAFTTPSSVPTPSATTNNVAQPPPNRIAASSATYCATDAIAVNEMSIPPDTSTTSNPAAVIPMNE